MSMLSAQCDELRAMAESIGLAMPQAATLMMDAADTIWELRNKCSNLVDERETAERNRTRNAREYARLCHENDRLREQTELLVTLLRNDCDIEASWDGLRKFWYIGLTESGCLMRDRACKAEADNAKLRDGAYAMRQLYEDELKHALAENAKLRELVDYVTPIAWYAASERERDHMRELGVEVDG